MTYLSRKLNFLERERPHSSLVAGLKVETDGGLKRRHSLNIAKLLISANDFLGQDEKLLGQIAFWHDIGCLRLSGEALTRKGRLSEAEKARFKLHPQFGLQIAKRRRIELPKIVLKGIIGHHLRFGPGVGVSYPHYDSLEGNSGYSSFGLVFSKEDDLICAALRVADSLEAGTSVEREGFEGNGTIDVVTTSILDKIKNGWYSPFQENNLRLPGIFANMVRLRRNDYQEFEKEREVGF
jgi:hypothetical protein